MRICFYFEYKDIVGGYTSLLITLIKGLSEQNVDTLLFNYKDGLVAEELKKSGIDIPIADLEELDWDKIDQLIDKNDVFIITSFLEIFHHFFSVNPRLVYYDINDFIGDISKYKWGINPRRLAKKLVERLIEERSLVCMDDTGIVNVQRNFGLNIENPKFLPIPVIVPEENVFLTREIDAKVIRLSYIGRSVSWKINPLKKIIDDLHSIADAIQKRIVFSIVVDSISELQKSIDFQEYKGKSFCDFVIYEKIKPSEITGFLLENSDINFGMGTTALDSGKLGIPTILMDYSSKEFPASYRYKWLYNTRYYSLGRNIEREYVPNIESFDMVTLMRGVQEKDFIESQSILTYEYVKSNHSVKGIVKQLQQHALEARFRFQIAKPYILYYSKFHSWIRKMKRAIQE